MKFKNVQLKIIEFLLHVEILNTSRFVKNMIEKKEYTKGWIWKNIYDLEDEGLIERINPEANQKKNIKHRKLFTKESLEKDYNVFFVDDKKIEDNPNNKTKEEE